MILMKSDKNSKVIELNLSQIKSIRSSKVSENNYKHAYDAKNLNLNSSDLYVSVDADVSKPVDLKLEPKLPDITPNKTRKSYQMNKFALKFNRRRHNLSLASMKNKFQNAHLSNLTLADPMSVNKSSNLTLKRHRFNKSVSHHMSQPSPIKMNRQGMTLEMSQDKPFRCKKTFPSYSRFNMLIKDGSNVVLPNALIHTKPVEKLVVFVDIKTYIAKLAKK